MPDRAIDSVINLQGSGFDYIDTTETVPQAADSDHLNSVEKRISSEKKVGLGALSADALMQRIEELEAELESERGKRDFAESVAKRAFEEARRAIDHEPMTGLLTRGGLYRQYDNWLDEFMADESDYADGESLSSRRVVAYFVDLDDFKIINSTYGHANGDIAIKVLASLLESEDDSGLNARLGGDECAAVRVVSGGVEEDLQLATEFREKMLGSIRDTETSQLNESFFKDVVDKYEVNPDDQDRARSMLEVLSFSVGSSSLPIADANGRDNIGLMLDHADKMMFDAKAKSKARKVTRSLPRDD